MMLTAYAQAVAPECLQLWVGLFDTETPPVALGFELNEQPVVPEPIAAVRPIRDAMSGAGAKPLNHRGIFRIANLEPARPYRVAITAGTERVTLLTRTLPSSVPQMLDGSFNILLCSCYYQSEDASGLLGTIASQIRVRPDLTMMLGDQIYGDLPLFEDLPEDEAGVARKLGAKYRRNWASLPLGIGGLGLVLGRAPVVCVADDHEFWNNYPFRQTQLPKTWTDDGRKQWREAALALYEDYQVSPTGAGAQRIDVDPLKILVVDMRCHRDESFARLMLPETMRMIERWRSDLIDAKRNGQPAFGLLASGQALFVTAADESKRRSVDAEMANYTQFTDEILPELDRLADEGIPVVYVTGDVHWGRVSQGIDLRRNRILLYEVISSPSRLIRVPFADSAKETLNVAKGLFGKADPWPRHSQSQPVPDRFGSQRRFQLRCDLEHGDGVAQRGDQIAIMSFSRAGGGINFSVSYYGITPDKALAQSHTTPTYELRII